MNRGNEGNPRFPPEYGFEDNRTDVAMNELLELLNGDERTRLAEVERRLDDPKALADMVQKALQEALKNNPAQMEEVLRPLVIAALMRQDSGGNSAMKEAVTPVVGSATTSAVKQAFNDRMVSLSQTLSRTFSLDGLKWRIESIKTGQPFSEIAMRNSAVYEICDVYLIDRASGLLMLRVGGENSIESNPDAAAGMLTAIQDFARDSAFAGNDTELSRITLSDHTIYLEDGRKAYLAAVVRGNAPIAEVRPQLRKALETYHKEHAKELQAFGRDSTALAEHTSALKSCLISRGNVASLDQKFPVAKRYLVAAWICLALPLLLLFGWWLHQAKQKNQQAAFVEALRDIPGVVVSHHETKNGKLHINGLRDEFASRPVEEAIEQAGLGPEDLVPDWETFPFDHAEYNLKRAKARLNPPANSVQLDLKDNTLVASGTASDAWLRSAETKAAGLLHISGLNTDRVVTPSRLADKIRSLLPPSPKVQVQANGNVIHIFGEAPRAWIGAAKQKIATEELNAFDVEFAVKEPPPPPPPPPPPKVVEPPPPPPPPPPPVFPEQTFRRYQERLKNEPGIEILAMEKRNGVMEVIGRRDRFASAPNLIKQEIGLEAGWVKERWTDYQSDEPAIVERRVANLLRVVPGLRAELKSNNRLVLTGQCDPVLLGEVRSALLNFKNVDFVNVDAVQRTP